MPTPNEIARSLATLDITADKLAGEIIEIVERNDNPRPLIAKHLAFIDCLRDAAGKEGE